jgi:hypothetical protein
MNNEQEEAKKGDTKGDLSKRTDKGKSSHASSAENRVTSHEIADRNETTKGKSTPLAITKDLCALRRSTKKKAMLG